MEIYGMAMTTEKLESMGASIYNCDTDRQESNASQQVQE